MEQLFELGTMNSKEIKDMKKQVTIRAIYLYFMEHFSVKDMSLKF